MESIDLFIEEIEKEENLSFDQKIKLIQNWIERMNLLKDFQKEDIRDLQID